MFLKAFLLKSLGLISDIERVNLKDLYTVSSSKFFI